MSKTCGFLVVAVVGGLIAWLGVLHSRLVRSERERHQFQAAHQQLATQHHQATEEIETLGRQLSVQRDGAAEVADPRARAAKSGGKSRAEAGVLPYPSGGTTAAGKDSPQLRQSPAGIDAGIEQRFGPLAGRFAWDSRELLFPGSSLGLAGARSFGLMAARRSSWRPGPPGDRTAG